MALAYNIYQMPSRRTSAAKLLLLSTDYQYTNHNQSSLVRNNYMRKQFNNRMTNKEYGQAARGTHDAHDGLRA